MTLKYELTPGALVLAFIDAEGANADLNPTRSWMCDGFTVYPA